MRDVVGRGASRERFALVLMGAFALVSLGLAVVGLYGVLSLRGDASARRRSASAWRSARRRPQVRALVMRQAAVVVGHRASSPGSAGALLLGRWLGALAFGVGAVRSRASWRRRRWLLAAVAAVAAWLPARRAARIEPRIAMQDAQLTRSALAAHDAAPHDARDHRHRQHAVARERGHRGAHRRIERAGVRRRHALAREPVL